MKPGPTYKPQGPRQQLLTSSAGPLLSNIPQYLEQQQEQRPCGLPPESGERSNSHTFGVIANQDRGGVEVENDFLPFVGKKIRQKHHRFGTRELWDTPGCPRAWNPFFSGIVLIAWLLTLLCGKGRDQCSSQLGPSSLFSSLGIELNKDRELTENDNKTQGCADPRRCHQELGFLVVYRGRRKYLDTSLKEFDFRHKRGLLQHFHRCSNPCNLQEKLMCYWNAAQPFLCFLRLLLIYSSRSR